ncbi:hypothetical protein C8Q80DRAFT_1122100 [Daedaleopsis nitida]|nr:hypothetical protein C8Q80DRAFT_1122100 [Daedaleopsis nitida]
MHLDVFLCLIYVLFRDLCALSELPRQTYKLLRVAEGATVPYMAPHYADKGFFLLKSILMNLEAMPIQIAKDRLWWGERWLLAHQATVHQSELSTVQYSTGCYQYMGAEIEECRAGVVWARARWGT